MPTPGVERVMLDRVDGEVARATGIVRYASRPSFPQHLHPAGEEILVLSGTFSYNHPNKVEAAYRRVWHP